MMRKLLILLLTVVAVACGDSRQSARDDDSDTEERLEEGMGEEISPQLVPDDSLSESRFDVDTISSAEEARQQMARDSIN